MHGKNFAPILLIVVLLYFIHEAIIYFFKGNAINLASATLLLVIYVWFILTIERKEFQRIPLLKNFYLNQ